MGKVNMKQGWEKFTSLNGGFQSVFIMDSVVDGVPDKYFQAALGTFSGGGEPRWLKPVPEFKNDATKTRAKGMEKLKIEKQMAKIRQKIDTMVHNEMRRLGYTKQEDSK